MRVYIFVFLLLFVSCASDKKKEIKVQFEVNELLETAVDTLTCMNSLFSSEKLYLDSSIKMGEIRYYSCDNKDNIYLLDINSEIFVFNKLGEFIRKISKVGRGPGEYLSIERFTFDKNNNIYIDDWRQLSIKKYDQNFAYLGMFPKKMGIPCVDMKISGQKLYLFSPFANEHSIAVFDIDTYEQIDILGKTDDLQKKYLTRLNAGSLIIKDEIIYYTLPNYYQIFGLYNGSETQTLDHTPAHFKQVDEKITNPFKDLNKFSAVFSVFNEGDYFFIQTSPAKGALKRKNNEKMPTDIVSLNGEILKENVFYKDFQKFLVKYDSKKYLSFGYDEGDEKEYANPSKSNIKPYVLFLKYRY